MEIRKNWNSHKTFQFNNKKERDKRKKDKITKLMKARMQAKRSKKIGCDDMSVGLKNYSERSTGKMGTSSNMFMTGIETTNTIGYSDLTYEGTLEFNPSGNSKSVEDVLHTSLDQECKTKINENNPKYNGADPPQKKNKIYQNILTRMMNKFKTSTNTKQNDKSKDSNTINDDLYKNEHESMSKNKSDSKLINQQMSVDSLELGNNKRCIDIS
jgi:hypothetical protein